MMYGQNIARPPIVGTLSFESFLEMLNPKDRVNAQKHVAICETNSAPCHAILWRELVCSLMALAGHSAKLNRNPPSAQFYVVDGKYRMQVFAIEDEQQGELRVYCGDVLDQAIKNGILVVEGNVEQIIACRTTDSGERITIERLDCESINPAACFKDMVGWNRKAIRVTLPITASPSQVAAVKSLCASSMRAASVQAGVD